MAVKINTLTEAENRSIGDAFADHVYNGSTVKNAKQLASTIPMLYTECVKEAK